MMILNPSGESTKGDLAPNLCQANQLSTPCVESANDKQAVAIQWCADQSQSSSQPEANNEVDVKSFSKPQVGN